MIITCHKCKTSFVTKETLIGSSGRYVKCSKCDNIWFATIHTKPNNSRSLVINESLKVQLPAIVKQPAKLWQFILLFALAIILMQLIVSVCDHNQYAKSLKNLTCKFSNSCSNDYLKLQTVKADYNIDTKTFAIEYKIINDSDKAAKFPLIKISLLDKNLSIIKANKLNYKDITIKPLSEQIIKTAITDVPTLTHEIDIEIGNWLYFIIN